MSVPWYLMAKGKGGGGYKTASGPIVSISDALAAPLRSLLVNIDPVQDLHGYDNPWPAGGGKNLLDPSKVTEVTANLWQWYVGEGFALKANTKYTLSNFTPNENVQMYILDATGTTTIVSSNNVASYTPTEDTIVIFQAYKSGGIPSGALFQIEVGDKTTYVPYSNICPISGWTEAKVWVKPTYDPTADPTATIQLGQTVYGGTLDVLSGVLTVERAMVDMGTLEYSSGFSGFYTLGIKDDIKVPTTVAQSGLKSDIFIVGNTSNADNMYIQITGAYVGWVVFLPSATYATAADFKTAMNGHQLVYELATPITIPLTPQEISTLAGQNVMWADCGEVTVEYLSAGGANPDLMKLAVAFMGRK